MNPRMNPSWYVACPCPAGTRWRPGPWLPVLMIVVLLAGAMPGSAQDDADPSPATEVGTNQEGAPVTTLAPISVTGERPYDPLEDPIVTPANDEPFTAHVKREEIERRQPANAAEALRYVSPNLVFTRQNRKYRNFYDFRGERVSLAVDGTPIQDGTANGSLRGDDRFLDLMGTDQIESIDLVKDSSAMVYGTLRGGLVHIRTRKPGPGKSGRVSLGYGSFATKEFKLHFSNRFNDQTAFLVGFGTYDTQGPTGRNADETHQNLYLKWFRDFSPKDSLEVGIRRDVGEFGIPIDSNERGQVPQKYFDQTVAIVRTEENGWRYDHWVNTLFDLKYQHAWTPDQRTDLHYSQLNVTNDFHNPRGESATPIGHISPHHVIENTTAYSIRHTSKWAHGIITRLGYLYDHWHNPTGKLYWENRDNEDEKHSSYVQGEVPFGSDQWLFDAGYRRDRRYMITEDRFRATGGAPKVLRDTWEDPRDNFSTGLTFKPTDRDTVALRYGSIEVSPVDRYSTVSGNALTDEKDTLVNLGYEHRFKQWRNASINLNFFTNDKQDALVDDKVIPDPVNAGTVIRTFKNQTTKVKGHEIALTTGLGKHFDLRFGLGQMNYDPDEASRPKINTHFSLMYNGPRDLQAELYGISMGETQTSTQLTTGTTLQGKAVTKYFPYQNGDYTDLNLVLRKRFANRSGNRFLTLAVRNLLDGNYETTSASNLFAPAYGRTFQVNYDIEF